MRTLILGNGLIGKSIAKKLVAEKHTVTIASRSVEERMDNVTYVQNTFEEIVNNDELFKNADNIIQTICTSSPASSMQDIYKDAYENVLLNVKLMEMLRQSPVQKFIFLSSGGSVYGNEAVNDVDEMHPTHPISAYGVAKINVEKYLYLYGYWYRLHLLDDCHLHLLDDYCRNVFFARPAAPDARRYKRRVGLRTNLRRQDAARLGG